MSGNRPAAASAGPRRAAIFNTPRDAAMIVSPRSVSPVRLTSAAASRAFWITLVSSLTLGAAMAEEVPSDIKSLKSPYSTFGKLESNDPRFDKLFPPGAKMEKLAEGFEWCEGPVWVADGKFLLFSDI